MFKWFIDKFRPKQAPDHNPKLTAEAVQMAVSAYGRLLEQHPVAILDASNLPLPKVEMKKALKVAWRLAADDRQRNAIEVSYVQLSQFQDGVGDKPIDSTLPADADPAKVLETLSPIVVEWQRRSLDEMQDLNAEIDAFKRKYRESQASEGRPDNESF